MEFMRQGVGFEWMQFMHHLLQSIRGEVLKKLWNEEIALPKWPFSQVAACSLLGSGEIKRKPASVFQQGCVHKLHIRGNMTSKLVSSSESSHSSKISLTLLAFSASWQERKMNVPARPSLRTRNKYFEYLAFLMPLRILMFRTSKLAASSSRMVSMHSKTSCSFDLLTNVKKSCKLLYFSRTK